MVPAASQNVNFYLQQVGIERVANSFYDHYWGSTRIFKYNGEIVLDHII